MSKDQSTHIASSIYFIMIHTESTSHKSIRQVEIRNKLLGLTGIMFFIDDNQFLYAISKRTITKFTPRFIDRENGYHIEFEISTMLILELSRGSFSW